MRLILIIPIIFCVPSRQVGHGRTGKALHQTQYHIHACGTTTGSDDVVVLNPACLGNSCDMGTLGDNPGEGLLIAGGPFSVHQTRRR